MSQEEENEFQKMVANIMTESKIEEINPDILKNILLTYLKSGSAKFSFAFVPDWRDTEGIDPYADLGDVAPGESIQKERKKSEEELVQEEIDEAEAEGFYEKVQLLKRIKQLAALKKHTRRLSEEESINMVIAETYEQIQALPPPEDEGDFYDQGEGEEDMEDVDLEPQHSKVSRKEETIEEKREKGLKEIFNHYSRSQMLIGKKATFEEIQHEISNLNLGEYMKFCKDFNIPVSKTK